MTLLTTEIHHHTNPDRALIVFAADRWLSYPDGRQGVERVKTMKLSGLNGGIGYFGLAQVPGGAGVRIMDEWLVEFMKSRPAWASLQEFFSEMAAALNTAVPRTLRLRVPRCRLHLRWASRVFGTCETSIIAGSRRSIAAPKRPAGLTRGEVTTDGESRVEYVDLGLSVGRYGCRLGVQDGAAETFALAARGGEQTDEGGRAALSTARQYRRACEAPDGAKPSDD